MKKRKVKLLPLLIILLIITSLLLLYKYFFDKQEEKIVVNEEVSEEIEKEDIKEEIIVEEEIDEETLLKEKNDKFFNVDSILLIANKKHPLESDYVPSDLVQPNVRTNKSDIYLRSEASIALEEMFKAAQDEGIYLVLGSGYRSYNYQKTLYDNYVARDGEEAANRYSAKPGYSEHQTGLAVDISDYSQQNFLKQNFENTSEGKWLFENSYKYGYVLRYLKDKEDITGYMYEPWHYRYIGKKEALEVKESNLSLEEYYDILD